MGIGAATVNRSFGATSGLALCVSGLICVLPASDAAGFAGRGNTEDASRCEVEAELVAVVYNPRKPERSFALVAQGRNPARLVGVGSWVEGMRVVAIRPKALWLDAENDACWLPMAREPLPHATPQPKRKRERAKRARNSKKKKRKRR